MPQVYLQHSRQSVNTQQAAPLSPVPSCSHTTTCMQAAKLTIECCKQTHRNTLQHTVHATTTHRGTTPHAHQTIPHPHAAACRTIHRVNPISLQARCMCTHPCRLHAADVYGGHACCLQPLHGSCDLGAVTHARRPQDVGVCARRVPEHSQHAAADTGAAECDRHTSVCHHHHVTSVCDVFRTQEHNPHQRTQLCTDQKQLLVGNQPTKDGYIFVTLL